MILAVLNLLLFADLIYIYKLDESDTMRMYAMWILFALFILCIVFSILTIFDNL